jgi:hypothetical protein
LWRSGSSSWNLEVSHEIEEETYCTFVCFGSSGRSIWLMKSKKNTKKLTLSRVIVHCRGLNVPPWIWRSHEIWEESHCTFVCFLYWFFAQNYPLT